MVRKEQAQEQDFAQDFTAQDQSADLTGSGVDLREFDSVTAFISVGTITDGTHDPQLQHAEDDGSGSPDTWEDVPAEDVVDDFSDLSSDEIQWAAYIGNRRHLRHKIAVTGATTGGDYHGGFVRGGKRKVPTQ